jgi:superfamily II DNA or RNA helicase
MELRPYQKDCLAACSDAERRGVTRQLVVMATGLGKRVLVCADVARRGLPKTFGFMHRDELISQMSGTMMELNPAARIGIEKAESRADPQNSDIVLASVQTVGRADRMRLSRFPSDWPAYVFIDEAHHAPSKSYLEVISHFGFYGDEPRRDRILTAWTATPDRLDEMGYDKIFDDVVYRYGLREAIKDGWLADIRAWRLQSELDLARVRVVKGEFVDKDLEEAIDDSRMKEVAVATWAERCRGRRSLVFCVTKKHAHEVRDALERKGAKAAVVVEDTPRDERRDAIARFRAGELEVLTGCGIFLEGFDCPEIECIHILRPTRSRTCFVQMVGRGTRKTQTKSHVELYDYTAQVHDICSIGQIFGLPDSWELDGQSVEEDARKVEQIEADLGLKADGAKDMPQLLGRIRERRVEMIRGALTDSGLPSRLAWIRPSQTKERWFISWRNEARDKLDKIPPTRRKAAERVIGEMNLWGVHERIEVFRNELGHYEAKLHRSGPDGSNTREGRLDGDRSLAKLVSRLDKLVIERRPHKERLLLKSSPWTRQPATPAQKDVLMRKGVPEAIAAALTKGEAGNLINMPGAVVRKWFDGMDGV